MKRIIIVLLFSLASLYANKVDILHCLYPEVKPFEVLKEKGLDTKGHIKNLLYAEKHKYKYFLKALVLDYYYHANNIESFYKKAYKAADIQKKDLVGIYYAFYLQKQGEFEKATNLLRGIDVYASKKYNIQKKIGYLYVLFDLEPGIKIDSYLKKIKKVDIDVIKKDIDECSK